MTSNIINKYLARIKFNGDTVISAKTLFALHKAHVFHVPFENLDIHLNRRFGIGEEEVYKKVVENSRGGFCYELNSLFNSLLTAIDFKSRIISCRIFTDAGNLGPEFDHMALLVEINDDKYLADVGFGDLFLTPIKICQDVQTDGRNFFTIIPIGDKFTLSMSSRDGGFERKYDFSLANVSLSQFYAICIDKQVNPGSYFVKNLICTKPTATGRITLFNNRLIERRGEEKIEAEVGHPIERATVLLEKYDLRLTEH